MIGLHCHLVGLAVVVLAFMNTGRMINRCFGEMQVTMRATLVTMNSTMPGIQRFLDQQERPGPG